MDRHTYTHTHTYMYVNLFPKRILSYEEFNPNSSNSFNHSLIQQKLLSVDDVSALLRLDEVLSKVRAGFQTLFRRFSQLEMSDFEKRAGFL